MLKKVQDSEITDSLNFGRFFQIFFETLKNQISRNFLEKSIFQNYFSNLHFSKVILKNRFFEKIFSKSDFWTFQKIRKNWPKVSEDRYFTIWV